MLSRLHTFRTISRPVGLDFRIPYFFYGTNYQTYKRCGFVVYPTNDRLYQSKQFGPFFRWDSTKGFKGRLAPPGRQARDRKHRPLSDGLRRLSWRRPRLRPGTMGANADNQESKSQRNVRRLPWNSSFSGPKSRGTHICVNSQPYAC